MTIRRYLIKEIKRGFSGETYKKFNNEYHGNLRIINTLINNKTLRTYDINDTAVILTDDQSKDSLRHFGNMVIISSKDLINKTIKEIKQKGFSLEEITI